MCTWYPGEDTSSKLVEKSVRIGFLMIQIVPGIETAKWSHRLREQGRDQRYLDALAFGENAVRYRSL